MFNCVFSVKGVNDILPSKIFIWHYVEDIIKKLMISYGYCEIRIPIIEKTVLYKKLIGDFTDVVQKEMYSFEDIDKSNTFISLRPEGTIGCVRAVIENGLIYNKKHQKIWYIGPMFRRENTQKGRYRQFYQFGVEAFGICDNEVDIEQILIVQNLLIILNLREKVKLQINCIGSIYVRMLYKDFLFIYFFNYIFFFTNEEKIKLLNNPIRLLDSKNIKLKDIIKNSPKILNFINSSTRNNFYIFLEKLCDLNINFTLNENLVRGLDYYNDIVYEWVFNESKSQNSLCGGGRYDNLIKQFGFKNIYGVGFGIGLERLIMLYSENFHLISNQVFMNVFLVFFGEKSLFFRVKIAELIRLLYPNIFLFVCYDVEAYIKQRKILCDNYFSFIFVIDDDNLKNYSVNVKFLSLKNFNKIISIDNLDILWS